MDWTLWKKKCRNYKPLLLRNHFKIWSTKCQPFCLGLNELSNALFIKKKNCELSHWNRKTCILIFGCKIQLSDVITRSNITWYCTHHCRKWGRISIRGWTHKTHPIPRPLGRAMGCFSWIFYMKIYRGIMAQHCSWLKIYCMGCSFLHCFVMV